ncbi:MAG: Hsp70 family protein, partial [Cyanobacteria bacterium P01_H01_bin.15]
EKTLSPVRKALKDAELGSGDVDRVILVGGSTRIPSVQSTIQEVFGAQNLDYSVNPDEAVALGAAIQGGVLGGEVEDILLLDVTPLSLGVETLGEVFTKVIERNTTIPTSRSQEFSTAVDGQNSVEIHALQGERPMARDNKTLGRFLLTGIPPAPRGVPQIEVTFEIDVNGILQVSAQDRGTGREQSIKISNTGGLSQSEIERMREEAERYADSDQRRLEEVELRNQADTLFYSFDTTLKENPDLISGRNLQELEEKKRQLQSALNDSTLSIDEIREILEEFRNTLLSAGSEIYGQTGEPGGTEGGSGKMSDKALANVDDDDFKLLEQEILTGLKEVDDASETQFEPEFNYDFDETMTGDYEDID